MSTAAAVKQPSQIVPASKKVETIRDLLQKQQAQIERALPRHMDADKLARITMTVIQKNPELLACDPFSLLGAVMQTAQLGLSPDGALGHSYLVPFKGKVVFIPGYRGLIELALRSGKITKIIARVVYKGDRFEYQLGTDEKIVHVPGPTEKRGEVIAAYAVAKLVNGDTQFDVMERVDLDAVRLRSPAGNAGPWVTDTAEMQKKTVVRRLSKYLQLSVELATAVDLDERSERGESQNLEDFFESDEEKAPAKPSLDSIVDAAEAK